jgi:hypothetical protein
LDEFGQQGSHDLIHDRDASCRRVGRDCLGLAACRGTYFEIFGGLDDAGGTLRDVQRHQHSAVVNADQPSFQHEDRLAHTDQPSGFDGRTVVYLLVLRGDSFERAVAVAPPKLEQFQNGVDLRLLRESHGALEVVGLGVVGLWGRWLGRGLLGGGVTDGCGKSRRNELKLPAHPDALEVGYER